MTTQSPESPALEQPPTEALPQVPPAPQAPPLTAAPQPAPVAHYPQPVPAPTNGVALTAMIFGIVGAVVGFWAVVPITGYLSAAFGFPLALTAVICGHIGQSRAKRLGGVGRVQALVAVLTGYLSLAVMIIASAAWTIFLFVGTV